MFFVWIKYVYQRSVLHQLQTNNKKYWKKATTNTRSLNKYDLFEKRNERKNSKVTKQLVLVEENPCFGKIMDASKGSLRLVRRSKLPVKVGKYMTADKVCVFVQKNI